MLEYPGYLSYDDILDVAQKSEAYGSTSLSEHKHTSLDSARYIRPSQAKPGYCLLWDIIIRILCLYGHRQTQET